MTRKILEAAAKACGLRHVDYTGIDYDGSDGLVLVNENGCHTREWNPRANSADTAAMCAKLFIDSDWYANSIRTQNSTDFDTDHYEEWSYFKDHNNDREAAWRFAATMVAAKIGGME